MISLEVQDTKYLMGKLLKDTTFDDFLVANIEISNFATFEINTKKNAVSWEVLRPYTLNIIKGKEQPKYIKIVFLLNQIKSESIAPDCGFFLNLHYRGELYFTTGTSTKTFNPDKSIEHVWEDYIKNFFKINKFQYKLVE